MKTADSKIEKLKNIVMQSPNAVIAFSGGTDSSYLLKICKDFITGNLTAVHIRTPYMSERDYENAISVSEALEIRTAVIDFPVNSEVMKNPENRCYLCKKAILSHIRKQFDQKGTMFYEGTNHDDLSLFRPGIAAVRETGFSSPLAESGFTKNDIRNQSKKLRIPVWNRPASPCLLTRFPFCYQVTSEELKMVEKAELFLESLGCSGFRVRSHNKIASIQASSADMKRLCCTRNKNIVVSRFSDIGFSSVNVDLSGYQMNVPDTGNSK